MESFWDIIFSLIQPIYHIRMQSCSNNQSIEEQSFHSLKLEPHIQSLPQQPSKQQTLLRHENSAKPPSSKISISSEQEFEQVSGEDGPQIQSLANIQSQQQSRKKLTPHSHQQKKSQISNFIIKTYRILEDPVNSNIIHWTDEGNAFIVKNKDKFQNEILPKYFKHKKFSSFVRQLNMYDFHKIRKEKQIPIFKHKYFREGCVDLLCKIKRKSGEEGGNVGGDDEEGNQAGNQAGTKNYIPSLLDFTEKPMISAYSFKSKSSIPFPSMLPSQPSIGLLPGSGAHASELDLLLQENNELTTSISELTREQAGLQLQRERKREKIIKILSILVNFDFNESIDQEIQSVKESPEFTYTDNPEILSLRDLQNHFASEEEPFSFVEYAGFMKDIYKNIKGNMMKMNSEIEDQPSEQHKIEEERS